MKKRARTLAAIPVALAALASGCGGKSSSPPATSSRARPATPRPHHRPTLRPHPKARPRPEPRRSRHVLVGQIPERLPTRRRVVALTFDAGANDAGAAKIFAALRAADAPATFFITGRWAELYPGWARRIAARYPIGNHTFDHRDLRTLTSAEVGQEIQKARATIAHITRQRPAPLFRFPYGSSSPSTVGIANRLGYTAVGWTVDTLGWEGTSNGQTTRSIVAHALSHLQPGEIILMHVGSNPTDRSTLDADALPTIIRDIRRRGYIFVALPGYL